MSKKGKTEKKPNKGQQAEKTAVASLSRNETYERELERLQVELSHLQSWVKATGARIILLFEGRDAAGKGGVIKRITERVEFERPELGKRTPRPKTVSAKESYRNPVPDVFLR